MTISRRNILGGAFAGAAAALLPPGRSQAAATAEAHGLSLFGDLKYAADFKHFDYVRPDAPKGGPFSTQVSQTAYNQEFNTFDSLHIYVLNGAGGAGMDLTFASLMARALDEPDAVYGLAARSVSVSEDRLTYRFHLRDGITFHDGTPITAEDCAWSFNILRAQGHPLLMQVLLSFVEARAEGTQTVAVQLGPDRGRDLPLTIATLPIFSKAWWQGRDFKAVTREVPLGSGPYRFKSMDIGRAIRLERVPGWWGETLPSQVGSNNFDTLEYQYFRSRPIAFEAFKAGAIQFREEFTSRTWATQYDFPAVRDGRIRRETLPDRTPSGSQGWYFNCRRPHLTDPRVRRALAMMFDFEWANRNLMASSFERCTSVFENSPFKATGKPDADELALLEPFRGKVPDSVFGEALLPTVSDGSGNDRTQRRAALALLGEAGWHLKGGRLGNAAGETMHLEFLDDDDGLSPHIQSYIRSLKQIGVDASLRLVDAAQFQRRTNAFDYDILMRRLAFASSPGEGLRTSFGSLSAKTEGSQNLSGVADPVVDALVARAIAATSRQELTTACRALDRVIRAGYYWVPAWYKAEYWLAYWDKFGHPAVEPGYARSAPTTWWAKA